MHTILSSAASASERTTTEETNMPTDDREFSVGETIGIVIGGLVGLVILIVAGCFCFGLLCLFCDKLDKCSNYC